MAKIAKDLSAGTLHPRESLLIAGNLAANNAEIITDCDGSGSVSLDMRGTAVLTVEVSGTIDNTNWTIIPVRPINLAGVAYLASLVYPAGGGIWVGACAGFKRVRVRVTAYTSGSVTATLNASTVLLDQSLQGQVTSGLGTATGAASAAVTLTLAAPGAGLRHYLTFLTIDRVASALLTAAATPVVVTTTNLPGSLAFSLPADAAAQGTSFVLHKDYAFPMASSAQNTATTIVCPVATGVIWRVTAGFYAAP